MIAVTREDSYIKLSPCRIGGVKDDLQCSMICYSFAKNQYRIRYSKYGGLVQRLSHFEQLSFAKTAS
jgi:hypothetical protein